MGIIQKLFGKNNVFPIEEILKEYNIEKNEKKKLNYFLNSSNEGIILVCDNKIIDSNTKAREMFLISSFEDEYLSKLFCNEEDKCIYEINNLKIGEKKEFECKLIRDTGLSFIAKVVVNSFILRDNTLKIIAISDQTNIKRTENFYSILVETMGVGLVITDKKYNITYINSFIIKLTGLNEENILGRSIWDFLTNEDKNILRSKRIIKSSYSPDEFKIRVNLFDKLLYLKINIKPIFEHEKFNGNFIIITDETSHILDNIKLKESEKKYRDLINFIPETIIILSKSGIIKLCNIVGSSGMDLCVNNHIIDYFNEKYHYDLIYILENEKRFSKGIEFNLKNNKIPVLMSGFLTDNNEWIIIIADLTGFINSQDEIIRLENELNNTRKKLGRLIIEFNLSTEVEVESLIDKHKNKPRKTGEIAIELGLITEDDLKIVLEIQESRKIGSLLVNEKKITKEEKDLILEYQCGKISKEETVRKINEKRNTR